MYNTITDYFLLQQQTESLLWTLNPLLLRSHQLTISLCGVYIKYMSNSVYVAAMPSKDYFLLKITFGICGQVKVSYHTA